MTLRLWLIVGAVVAAIAVVGVIYFEGRSAGGNAARVDQLEQTNDTQRRINDADATGPRTPDAVDQRLRDGSF
jgi:hypothetical protein